MKYKFLYSIISCLTGCIIFFSTSKEARSWSAGAPSGEETGGCRFLYCHYGPAPVFVDGMITSNVPPGGYVPDKIYTLTASVKRAGHIRFGFEACAKDSVDNYVGKLIVTNSATTAFVDTSATEITHTKAGAFGTGSKTWNFNWKAPKKGTGKVTFYAAFNITNCDSSRGGDTILTSKLVLKEGKITTGIENKSDVMNESVIFPNPASGSVFLRYSSNGHTTIVVELYSSSGEKIKSVSFPDFFSRGDSTLQFPLNDVSPGVYFLLTHSGTETEIHKLIVTE